MLTRMLIQSLYGLVSVLFLLAGGTVLLFGTGLLPGPVREFILALAEGSPNTLHIMQEYASLLVFIGLITLWFLRHYDQSRTFHWTMTLFWGLIALVHWVDVRRGFDFDVGVLINTTPFALFLALGLLRERSAAKRGAASVVLEGEN